MTGPRIGELFAGYGGLGMGVKAVLGGEVAWYSDVCKFKDDGTVGHYEPHRGACRAMAHNYPGIPNHGDISAIDWSQVEPIDILTGGFPCQDVSSAGKRAGIRPGTRSGLWNHFAYAIDQLRPRLVVIENVRGLLSAEAHSDVEPCPWCVGDDTDGALRALGAVLGDLADLGYDASWYGVRAADVGAPHGRFRVFVTAYPQGDPWGFGHGDGGAVGRHRPCRGGGDDAALLPTPRTSDTNGAGEHGTGGVDLRTAVSLMPTPRATDGSKGGPNQRGSSGDLMLPSAVALLPTPAVNDMGEGKTVEAWDDWTAKMKSAHGNGNGHGASLAIEAQRLLPTPKASNNENRPSDGYTRPTDNFHGLLHGTERWGDYAAAIHRWEQTLGRPAPAPTQTSSKGNPQLAPAFVEWMMGLPAGWVTDVPAITRNEALKLCGNGVVPQQAEAALRVLLGRLAVAA